MNIGSNIKKIRKDKGILQKTFAEMLGNMPVSTLANYENNHRVPNIETLDKIATALGVEIRTLTSDENFSKELLHRSVYLALSTNPSDDFNVLSHLVVWTGDSESMLDLWNGNEEDLPEKCLKGLLKFIAETYPMEFKKIYGELILSGIYVISDKLKLFASTLKDSVSEVLNIHYSTGEIHPPEEIDNNFTSYNKSKYDNFLKLRILEFAEESDISLSNEESNFIVKNIDDLIYFELYKIKNKEKK